MATRTTGIELAAEDQDDSDDCSDKDVMEDNEKWSTMSLLSRILCVQMLREERSWKKSSQSIVMLNDGVCSAVCPSTVKMTMVSPLFRHCFSTVSPHS